MLFKSGIVFLIFMASTIQASVHMPTHGKAENCTVTSKVVEKTSKTFLLCPGFKFEQEASFQDDSFLRWGTVVTKTDTYVTLVLSNGVHGERVIVFSKNKKSQIKDIASSWPVEMIEKEGVSLLKYKMDSDPDGNYRSHFYRFE